MARTPTLDSNSDGSRSLRNDEVPARARRAFVLTMLLIVLYVILDIVVQLLPPHYDPISQPESDLAVGPFGWIMTANFVVRGGLSLLFLWGFLATVKASGGTWRRYQGGTIALAVWGVGAFVLAAFPTDVPSTPLSAHGAAVPRRRGDAA